jgi:hypothetical protein
MVGNDPVKILIMNEVALVELMETLKEFEEYTYFRDTKTFLFQNLNNKQFVKLYKIIVKHKLDFKVDKGLKIMLQ